MSIGVHYSAIITRVILSHYVNCNVLSVIVCRQATTHCTDLFAVTLRRASLAVTTIGDKTTSTGTQINVLKGNLRVIYPLLLAARDCLSTGLVGLIRWVQHLCAKIS